MRTTKMETEFGFPRWVQLTVPHSGTRYINNTFTQSGFPADSCMAPEKILKQKYNLTWQHWTAMDHPDYKPKIRWLVENSDAAWCTVRDPIMTFATHLHKSWRAPDKRFDKRHYAENCLDRMKAAYINQKQNYKRWGMFIFRVDRDDISVLGQNLGIELTPEAKTETLGDYDLKQACKDRNVDLIKHMCQGTAAWERFKYETSMYCEYYKSFGYDLWWIDG